jgi:dihydroneopterin aldolase/D-erythro-7,8-dihydroneopterin triphosphate epimerase
MDVIRLRELRIACRIGTTAAERARKQRLLIGIALQCDLAAAGRSDRVEDTIDYAALAKRIGAAIGAGRFVLIERVAAEVARICLREPRVKAVGVTVDKPGALRSANSAAVEIRRARGRWRAGAKS